MRIDTTHRTEESEMMDDFSLAGEELRAALDKIAGINKLLGGNSMTLHGVKKLLSQVNTSETITITDIGCGNGDMLRLLADFGCQHNLKFNLIGIDANAYTIAYARKLSATIPNISYICTDVFETDFSSHVGDIALLTLTLHHFTNEQILKLLFLLKENTRMGIVVNDLQRSKLSYLLFQTICFIFRFNTMTRADGLVSILRGFKKGELEDFSNKLNLKSYTIRWKWAFRYQWIISNI